MDKALGKRHFEDFFKGPLRVISLADTIHLLKMLNTEKVCVVNNAIISIKRLYIKYL